MITLTEISNYIPEPLRKVAQKAKVEHIGIIGSFLSVIAVAISCIFYYQNQPFTFFNHWVSNLGVGNNPAAYIFNIGLMVSAVFYFAFNVYLLKWLKPVRKSVKICMEIASFFNVIAVVGIFILTANDMVERLAPHSIGAYMFFGGSATYITLVYIALHLNQNATKFQFLLSLTILVLYLSITPVMWSSLPPSQWSTMLGYMGPELNAARLIEWICLFLFYAWLVQTSRLVIAHRKQQNKSQNPELA